MDNKQLLKTVVVATLVLLCWEIFAPNSIVNKIATRESVESSPASRSDDVVQSDDALLSVAKVNDDMSGSANTPRIKVNNGKIFGSINLKGAKIDDIYLVDYRKELHAQDKVRLLSYDDNPYLLAFGILNRENDDALPGHNTIWESDKSELSANDQVNLSWTNKDGVKFIINISLDDKYMFRVQHKIVNGSGVKASVAPYLSINRARIESKGKSMAVHEGAIVAAEGKLYEKTFDKLAKKAGASLSYGNSVSWFGFSDKYWLTAVAPDKSSHSNVMVTGYYNSKGVDRSEKDAMFQADVIGRVSNVDVGAEASIFKADVFVGAKVLSVLDYYKDSKNIHLFDKAVDFGIFYFITKPLFLLLEYIYGFVKNLGVALIVLTIVVKVILFPIAYKGLRGMKKLRDIAPQIAEIKKKYKNNSQMVHQKTMEAYREAGVSPLSGCLPMLIQMPVFFAVYKVLCVTIEMRHAPFIGWLNDLSAPDTTSVFNLFGLLPWDPPAILMIGVMPILMAVTMFIQQKMNPKPADESQAMVMNAMPFIFLVMFAAFPSGLLLYWTWSNVLSILQQYIIDNILDANKKSRIR